MPPRCRTVSTRWVAALCLLANLGVAADGQRLAYLDEPLDPYYVHRDFPKLITPQWVGDKEVEAVVTLAIDDMREPAKYEAFLRPILDRLKQLDGRAPVSIMTCSVKPDDPRLQAWLQEGLSLECHTVDHPCPLLRDGDLAKAKSTYDRCVDLLASIPGNQPVAFRMPCCDSLNTPSPRFWTEIFNKTTPNGNFLQIDSSVFNIITPHDKDLPREITLNEQGESRFRRYLPFKSFVNTIEDYPYPYVIGRSCWEFPCVVPSDWSAQHVQKPNNPDTVRDLKLALDAVVLKQGVFNLVFHPHGWIRNEQVIELIDHAVAKHGNKVKFLTFRECLERLNKNLLLDKPLCRVPVNVGLADYNRDGFIDVDYFGGLSSGKVTRRYWEPRLRSWRDEKVPGERGVLLAITHGPRGMLVRDIDGDGNLELIVQPHRENENELPQVKALGYDKQQSEILAPPGSVLFETGRRDAGLRLVDVNGDGKLDLLFSNAERYSLHLFKNMEEGWSIKVIDGVRGQPGGVGPVIPPFVRADGTNNGAWFHSGSLWVQNEDTSRLPDLVDRLSFDAMLGTNPKSEARNPK